MHQISNYKTKTSVKREIIEPTNIIITYFLYKIVNYFK